MLEIYVQEILIVYEINFLQCTCHDTVHILWSMSTESKKNVKAGLPHCSPWTVDMCSIQLEDMYCYGLWNVRHCSRNVCYVSKRCITSANVATDSWTASTSSPSLPLTSRHSSSIVCSMLKRKLPPYSLNDTNVFNSVITAHSSALITSTCCDTQCWH